MNCHWLENAARCLEIGHRSSVTVWLVAQARRTGAKISIDARFTCSTCDGTLGQDGCSFCNNEVFFPSYLREQPRMADQIATGVGFMRWRYPRTLEFLAYFQSYSSTCVDLPRLEAA